MHRDRSRTPRIKMRSFHGAGAAGTGEYGNSYSEDKYVCVYVHTRKDEKRIKRTTSFTGQTCDARDGGGRQTVK